MGGVVEANVSDKFLAGSIVVGTGFVPLVTQSFFCKRGILVKADISNSDIIFIGNSDVSVSGKGFPLAAGESYPIPLNDLAKLFAVSATPAQVLYFFAL